MREGATSVSDGRLATSPADRSLGMEEAIFTSDTSTEDKSLVMELMSFTDASPVVSSAPPTESFADREAPVRSRRLASTELQHC